MEEEKPNCVRAVRVLWDIRLILFSRINHQTHFYKRIKIRLFEWVRCKKCSRKSMKFCTKKIVRDELLSEPKWIDRESTILVALSAQNSNLAHYFNFTQRPLNYTSCKTAYGDRTELKKHASSKTLFGGINLLQIYKKIFRGKDLSECKNFTFNKNLYIYISTEEEVFFRNYYLRANADCGLIMF
jgi:hypothetical protein